MIRRSNDIKAFKITLDDNHILMLCDNKQTIDQINKDIATLKTKLRHVDIHNHWLREKARTGEIKVSYVTSKEQLADGLTKSLPIAQFKEWKTRIGLADKTIHLLSRKVKELNLNDILCP